MNVPPQLAAQLLETNFENICAKLKAGGTLTVAEAKMMQQSANGVASASSPPPAVANESAFSASSQNASPSLNLTPLPSPANGDGSVSREQLDAWAAIYGIQHRQLRRLIARGREKKHPCPLDDPRLMPAWVEQHVEKIRSDLWDKVTAAASAAEPAPAAGQPSTPVVSPPPTTPVTAAAGGMSIDLSTVGGVEGESVALFRALFAAARLELEEAYKSGTEGKKLTLHSRLEKIGESLRKHEAAAEAKAKRRGELLSRPEVFTAITEALNTLRLMREHSTKRVLSRLSTLDPSVVAQIAAALDENGRREEQVLASLPVLKSHDDLLELLAA